MKINKIVCLDEEIMQKLRQESNASALINRLLTEHFEISSEKKKNYTHMKETLLKNYSKKAREVRNEVKILRKVENLGADVRAIRWLRGHSEAPGILEISHYRRGRQITASSEKFVEAWNLINKHELLFEKI